jgi:hypothetical protein
LPRTQARRLVWRVTQGPFSYPRASQPAVLARWATARQAQACSPAQLARRVRTSPIPEGQSAIHARQANSLRQRQARYVVYAPQESFLPALGPQSAQTASQAGTRQPLEGPSARHASRARHSQRRAPMPAQLAMRERTRPSRRRPQRASPARRAYTRTQPCRQCARPARRASIRACRDRSAAPSVRRDVSQTWKG